MLPQNVERILTLIPNLCFETQNSYIVWFYNETDQGVIPCQIGSIEFLQWENDLVAANPITFEELEPFLS